MDANHDANQSDALARRLDELLSFQLGQRVNDSGASTGVETRNSVELARKAQPLLAVAGRFDALRAARPDDAYASALEARLLRYAQSIQPLNTPTVSIGHMGDMSDMSATLADHDAPALPTSGAAATARNGHAAPHWPTPQRMSSRLSPRARSTTRTGLRRLPGGAWAAVLAAAVLLTCTFGLFAVAASAAPGSALYGLRRLEQTIQSQLTTDPVAQTRLHLANAADALRALDLAAARHDSAAYDAAFATVQSEDAAAQATLAQVTPSAGQATLQRQLDALHASERQSLSADLPLLNWAEKVRTTTALGGLGVAAPVVTSAQIIPPGVTASVTASVTPGSAHGDGSSNGSGGGAGDAGGAGSQPGATHGWLVTVQGAGFAAGAQLVVDGQPVGQVISVTPTLLVATVDMQDAGALNRADSIGILAPNGEAAQTSDILRSASGTPQSPDSTPTTAPTPTPPGGDHKHGKGGH